MPESLTRKGLQWASVDFSGLQWATEGFPVTSQLADHVTESRRSARASGLSLMSEGSRPRETANLQYSYKVVFLDLGVQDRRVLGGGGR
jgi:hypothetical protein